MRIKHFLFAFIFSAMVSMSPSSNAMDNEFVILPGDILHINVWKEEGMDQETLVLPDGTITFPLVGSLQVRGLAPNQLEAIITEELFEKIPDASVTVSVKAPLGHTVSVIGQVNAPGDVVMHNRMSVMQALSQVGGLTPFADDNDIIVIRTNDGGAKERIKIPYNKIERGRDLDKDISLIPGDVVVVPTAGLF